MESPYTHILAVKFNDNGIVIHPKYLETEVNQSFADALLIGDQLVITYNETVNGQPNAKVISLSTIDFSANWHIQTGFEGESKSLVSFANGSTFLCAQRNAKFHFYKLDDSGNIEQSDQEFKTPSGFIERAISTSNNGLILTGATAPEYGSMMQVIKTDADLYLFEP